MAWEQVGSARKGAALVKGDTDGGGFHGHGDSPKFQISSKWMMTAGTTMTQETSTWKYAPSMQVSIGTSSVYLGKCSISTFDCRKAGLYMEGDQWDLLKLVELWGIVLFVAPN